MSYRMANPKYRDHVLPPRGRNSLKRQLEIDRNLSIGMMLKHGKACSLDADLLEVLQELNEAVYNKSKHSIEDTYAEGHMFSIADSLAVYLICRILGSHILKYSGITTKYDEPVFDKEIRVASRQFTSEGDKDHAEGAKRKDNGIAGMPSSPKLVSCSRYPRGYSVCQGSNMAEILGLLEADRGVDRLQLGELPRTAITHLHRSPCEIRRSWHAPRRTSPQGRRPACSRE